MDNIPSKLLENAVNEFALLPGIGKKTAMRLVLHLLQQDEGRVQQFAHALTQMKENIQRCRNCHNLSDEPLCSICSDARRQHAIVCVVEDIRDVLAIENTHQYRGVYHVLGGKISPMDGVGPSDLQIDSLIQRAHTQELSEIILALSSTPEGDTTSFYLYKKLQGIQVPITSIARGISFGGELEYADEVTLGRSILNRVPYKESV
ncbi:MAG: recombination mediator RecR [Flavobacteriales bacterium]